MTNLSKRLEKVLASDAEAARRICNLVISEVGVERWWYINPTFRDAGWMQAGHVRFDGAFPSEMDDEQRRKRGILELHEIDEDDRAIEVAWGIEHLPTDYFTAALSRVADAMGLGVIIRISYNKFRHDWQADLEEGGHGRLASERGATLREAAQALYVELLERAVEYEATKILDALVGEGGDDND